MAQHPLYEGPERRRHKVYVTQNTEYHLRQGQCVAVRNPKSDHWLLTHRALRLKLRGALRLHPDGTAVPTSTEPVPGEALFFERHGRPLITSPCVAVRRPERAVVERYRAVGMA